MFRECGPFKLSPPVTELTNAAQKKRSRRHTPLKFAQYNSEATSMPLLRLGTVVAALSLREVSWAGAKVVRRLNSQLGAKLTI